MNRAAVLAVLCLLASGAGAQYLETTILLPDTLGGVGFQDAMAYNINSFWFTCWGAQDNASRGVSAFDGRTGWVRFGQPMLDAESGCVKHRSRGGRSTIGR